MCNYLSMLGLKLNHVSKRGPWYGRMYPVYLCLHYIKAETIWLTLFRKYFEMHFLEGKSSKFYLNFTEVCSLGSNWPKHSTGFDIGLVPNMQQTIMWTDEDLAYWQVYASPSLNTLVISYLALLWSVMQRWTKNQVHISIDSLWPSDTMWHCRMW